MNKKKLILLLLFPGFIVYILSFYFLEREKWVNDKHAYPEAKKWLVLTNITAFHRGYLSKLPFVDERSLIIQPLTLLQKFFIKKWQDNLPNNDAEKYLSWYLFELNLMILPNVNSVILYGHGIYTRKEVRVMLDKIWFDIEKISMYNAKDKEFNHMRYAAFLNLTYLYVKNAMAYWHDGKTIQSFKINNDKEKFYRFLKLHKLIKKMDTYYKNNYYHIYVSLKDKRRDTKRLHKLLTWILDFYNVNGRYKQVLNYCDENKNIFLKEYLETRNTLLDLKQYESKEGKNSIEKTFSAYTEGGLNYNCNNLKLVKGRKYE